MDMVVEGLMVMQAKKKPTVGAQDLESFRHITQCLATIIGGFMAGYFIQERDPYGCYAALSVYALICALSGFLIDRNLERGDEDYFEEIGQRKGTL